MFATGWVYRPQPCRKKRASDHLAHNVLWARYSGHPPGAAHFARMTSATGQASSSATLARMASQVRQSGAYNVPIAPSPVAKPPILVHVEPRVKYPLLNTTQAQQTQASPVHSIAGCNPKGKDVTGSISVRATTSDSTRMSTATPDVETLRVIKMEARTGGQPGTTAGTGKV
jgi:hypothetical protein